LLSQQLKVVELSCLVISLITTAILFIELIYQSNRICVIKIPQLIKVNVAFEITGNFNVDVVGCA